MKFEKVSQAQYLKDCQEDTYYTAGNSNFHTMKDFLGSRGVILSGRFESLKLDGGLEKTYTDIKLPERSTKKSAGYDFHAPYDIVLYPGDTIKVATGIRVLLDDDKFLMCAPRSGHGFKSRIQLDNTVGIIDADYSDSSNEGHIHVKLTNDSRRGDILRIKKGDKMLQAIIMKYYTVDDDSVETLRNGGFGSTDE